MPNVRYAGGGVVGLRGLDVNLAEDALTGLGVEDVLRRAAFKDLFVASLEAGGSSGDISAP